jgi:hypothetical protein
VKVKEKFSVTHTLQDAALKGYFFSLSRMRLEISCNTIIHGLNAARPALQAVVPSIIFNVSSICWS